MLCNLHIGNVRCESGREMTINSEVEWHPSFSPEKKKYILYEPIELPFTPNPIYYSSSSGHLTLSFELLAASVNTWCVQVLRSPKEAFTVAMQSWRERCEECVCLQGDYAEKLLHFQLPVVSSFCK